MRVVGITKISGRTKLNLFLNNDKALEGYALCLMTLSGIGRVTSAAVFLISLLLLIIIFQLTSQTTSSSNQLMRGTLDVVASVSRNELRLQVTNSGGQPVVIGSILVNRREATRFEPISVDSYSTTTVVIKAEQIGLRCYEAGVIYEVMLKFKGGGYLIVYAKC